MVVDALPGFWHYADSLMVTGPFPLGWDDTWADRAASIPTDTPGFERAYAPEANPALDAQFETLDGTSGWRKLAGDPRTHMIDLRRGVGTTDDVVCYARAVIYSPRQMETELGLGSNDGARLWFGGRLVFSRHRAGAAAPNDNRIPVALKPGPNPVLVKVANLGAGWRVVLSVVDPERELRIVPHESLLDE